jgi:hypothetical protein
MSIKDFDKFFEEATVKGNPAFPGEGGKKEGESQYLSDIEKRAKERLGVRPSDIRTGMMPTQKEMSLGNRLGSLLEESLKYTEGKEKELSDLANVAFMSIYQELINRYDVEVDIKLVKPGKVKQFMDECEDCQDTPPAKFAKVVEQDIIDEVHKRKFANLIIQGEAKNTKHILHSDEVKEGLENIYGKEDAEKIFKIWDEMTKTADQLDWVMPPQVRADMMKKMPDGLAGACFVDWKKKEKTEEEKVEEPEQEYQEWTGEEDEESMYSDMPEDEPMEVIESTPVLKARGIDFPMLLHESVKGLFEILSLGGIPEDKEIADVVLSNTGISDEPEDWAYGPEIAADLRDFVNKSTRIDDFPNVREELFKLMIDKKTMPTSEFLELMRGILSNTSEARLKVDSLVSKICDKLRSKEEQKIAYQKELEEYERRKKEWDEYQKRMSGIQMSEEEVEKEEEIDYSTYSEKEIMDEIDSALDSGDYSRVEMLSKYLKNESLNIVLRELKLIKESVNLHTK